MAARQPALKSAGALSSSCCDNKKGRTAAWGQIKLHLLHCVHLSMSTRGTLIAMPRFSNWLVPKGTRPPGSKVLTGKLLPSKSFTGVWIFFANSAAWAMDVDVATLTEISPLSTTLVACAHSGGTLHSTMPSQLMFTPSMFICTTLSPFFPYIFLMLPFKSSMAASNGMTPLNLKKTLCMIMLMRLPKPALTPIFVASMM
mmetsp:Transcript_12903/g.26139  ORF Transcript_12903/g.26139 Transcript_12903/m.26139 type:complete len:200 (+) Transcript_12903:362-961(+)